MEASGELGFTEAGIGYEGTSHRGSNTEAATRRATYTDGDVHNTATRTCSEAAATRSTHEDGNEHNLDIGDATARCSG